MGSISLHPQWRRWSRTVSKEWWRAIYTKDVVLFIPWNAIHSSHAFHSVNVVLYIYNIILFYVTCIEQINVDEESANVGYFFYWGGRKKRGGGENLLVLYALRNYSRTNYYLLEVFLFCIYELGGKSRIHLKQYVWDLLAITFWHSLWWDVTKQHLWVIVFRMILQRPIVKIYVEHFQYIYASCTLKINRASLARRREK